MKSNTCRLTETEILLQLFVFKSCSAEGGINLLILFYRQAFCMATQQEKAIIINNTLLLLLVRLLLPHGNMQQFSMSTKGPNKSGATAVNSVLNEWQARNDKTDICNLRSAATIPRVLFSERRLYGSNWSLSQWSQTGSLPGGAEERLCSDPAM